MDSLASRRVLVTGGAAGLGASLVAACRARGDRVLSCDLAYERAAVVEPVETQSVPTSPTTESSSVDALHLDVRSEEDWAAAVAWVEEHWGGLDLLVNNAGVAGGGRLDVADLEEWQWILDINLLGVVRGTRAFVPLFKRQGSGRIVNVASLAGLVHPAGMASYNAVKAAVVALTETTGHELAEYGVTAHAVCPSYFRTGLMDRAQASDSAIGQVLGGLVANAPLGPDEIAAEVLAAVDRGEELILPDEAGRAAYELKIRDRAAYDLVMRKQAARLNALPNA